MLVKLAACVVVLGTVPALLLAFAGIPDGPREDVVPFETRTVAAEQQWLEHVGAICKWEQQQGKAFARAFRRAASPLDVEFLFKSAIRLTDESRAIFARLDVPLAYRREAKDLLRYMNQERAGLKGALEAFKKRRKAEFLRSVRRFVQADTKSSELLAQLGVDGCRVKPVTIPQSSRDRIV